jgi:AraC-like DNA-binding protein
MTVRTRTVPRQIKPELEHELVRSPNMGYESSTDVGFVRCLAHGFPTPLARWHYHDEYELHLITATSGKVFVGDWIGPFQPGQLVLTGPRLPHNWVTMDLPEGGVAERDLVIQFTHDPLVQASQTIPDLAACNDYRLLSSAQLQSDNDDTSLDLINDVVNRITEQLAEPHSAAAWAAELGMSESRFSRFFRKATGNTFTDFVNRVRISRACQLLMDTEQQITHICYEVGFNSVANFNRRFLEIKGMKPSDFRRQSLTRFSGAH